MPDHESVRVRGRADLLDEEVSLAGGHVKYRDAVPRCDLVAQLQHRSSRLAGREHIHAIICVESAASVYTRLHGYTGPLEHTASSA